MSTKMNLRTVTKYMSAALLCMGAQSVYACGSQPYIGEICAFAGNFCPYPDYIPASGQTLPISQNTALFSILGTTFGGNGTTNFLLPDLQGRVTVGSGSGTSGQVVVLGQEFGAATTTLTVAQLPAHSHGINATTTFQGYINASTTSGMAIAPSATNNYLGAATGTTKIYTSNHASSVPIGQTSGTATVSGNTSLTGSNQSTPTQPPSLGITYCIAQFGVFPTRN